MWERLASTTSAAAHLSFAPHLASTMTAPAQQDHTLCPFLPTGRARDSPAHKMSAAIQSSSARTQHSVSVWIVCQIVGRARRTLIAMVAFSVVQCRSVILRRGVSGQTASQWGPGVLLVNGSPSLPPTIFLGSAHLHTPAMITGFTDGATQTMEWRTISVTATTTSHQEVGVARVRNAQDLIFWRLANLHILNTRTLAVSTEILEAALTDGW